MLEPQITRKSTKHKMRGFEIWYPCAPGKSSRNRAFFCNNRGLRTGSRGEQAMKKILTMWVALFAGMAALAADNAAEKLPVRRVVLYKNGVGYFEHTGRVHGDQDLRIEFTSAQLNDVLMSLTVLDLSGGKIGGVGYNSVAPLAEQLKSLRLPLDETTTLESFLSALRGARIQVRNGAAVTSGRLFSVEEKTIKRPPNADIKSLELSRITDGGQVRTFQVTSQLG